MGKYLLRVFKGFTVLCITCLTFFAYFTYLYIYKNRSISYNVFVLNVQVSHTEQISTSSTLWPHTIRYYSTLDHFTSLKLSGTANVNYSKSSAGKAHKNVSTRGNPQYDRIRSEENSRDERESRAESKGQTSSKRFSKVEIIDINEHEGLVENMNIANFKDIPIWQRKRNRKKKYYLSEILMVRIYETDKAKWTIKELKQWLHYVFWAGVEHVYLCDHYVQESERLKKHLERYIQHGMLTYIDWPWNASRNYMNIMIHQVNCYDSVLQTYGGNSIWQMAVDMDEYPYYLRSAEEGFLRKYLDLFSLDKKNKDVCQILMPNFLMLGQGDRTRNITLERINRITREPANDLTKPLYRTDCIRRLDIHKHVVFKGKTEKANSSELMMLHFWGARLQDWGPDTPQSLGRTSVFDEARNQVSKVLRQSLLSFKEYDAFSNSTGP